MERFYLKPELALVYFSNTRSDNGILELFDVLGDKLVNPRLPSKSRLEAIKQMLVEQSKKNNQPTQVEDLQGLFDDNTVFVSKKTMAFIVPSRKASLHFSKSGEKEAASHEMLPNAIDQCPRKIRIVFVGHPLCQNFPAIPFCIKRNAFAIQRRGG